MKHFSCFLFSLFFYAVAFCISGQPAQQGPKKADTPDTKTTKTATPKAQPASTPQDTKQKPKKETPPEDADYSGPLSWRPGMIY